MENLQFSPGEFIGPFRFGMSKEEVKEIVRDFNNNNINFKNLFYFEFDDKNGLVTVEFYLSSVVEIYTCNYQGLNLFRTKAEDLYSFFGQEVIDKFTLTVPELKITFWRGNYLFEEDLKSEYFLSLKEDIQEDEKKYLYFETLQFATSANIDYSTIHTERFQEPYRPIYIKPRKLEEVIKSIQNNNSDISVEDIKKLINKYGMPQS